MMNDEYVEHNAKRLYEKECKTPWEDAEEKYKALYRQAIQDENYNPDVFKLEKLPGVDVERAIAIGAELLALDTALYGAKTAFSNAGIGEYEFRSTAISKALINRREELREELRDMG